MAHGLSLRAALCAFALAAISASATAQSLGGAGALHGLGEALQRIGEQQEVEEQQRRQHEREMERMRYQYELEAQRQRQDQAAQQQRQQLERQQFLQELDAAQPEWRVISQRLEFKVWLQNQPANVQALLRSNRSADVVLVLDLFQRDLLEQERVRREAQKRIVLRAHPDADDYFSFPDIDDAGRPRLDINGQQLWSRGKHNSKFVVFIGKLPPERQRELQEKGWDSAVVIRALDEFKAQQKRSTARK